MKPSRRILLISPVAPSIRGAGSAQRAFFHMQTLSALGELHLVVAWPRSTIPDLRETAEFCASSQVIPIRNKEKSSKVPGLSLFRKLLYVYLNQYRVDDDALGRWLDTVGDIVFDMVLCFQTWSFLFWEKIRAVRPIKNVALFVDIDDILSNVYRLELATTGRRLGLETQLMTRVDIIKARFTEQRMCRAAKLLSVCSKTDLERIEKQYKISGRAIIVPNTVPFFEGLPLVQESYFSTIVFVGTMNYWPNEDAARYLCQEILPVLRQVHRKELRLLLVGRNPSPTVQQLRALLGVTVTGAVDDVRDYYAQADLVVVPLRVGGGTRIKILEAMMFERPVVSTTIGAEGLDFVPDEEIIIADDPTSFAHACARLLNEAALRQKIARNGRAAVLAKYERTAVQEMVRCTIAQHFDFDRRV